MVATLAPVAALLLSAAILLIGSGLQGTLLPVRANLEAFSLSEIGFLGTAYYVGFGAGCYYGGRLVRRAGHIRTFAAMASLASVSALVHAIFLSPILWWGLRGLTGFCFAVLYVVIESWLNEQASNETRGRILSIYNAINLTMISAGQLMLTFADPSAFPLFALVSALTSVAVIPLAFTTAVVPAPVTNVHLRLSMLYRRSPVGCIGVLIVGLVNGAFWALAPVFAQDSGLNATGIAVFMSATVLAGAIAQWPLGRMSDSRDRRQVIVGACLVGMLGSCAMLFGDSRSQTVMFTASILFGSGAFPLYSLCLAHMNDLTPRDAFVSTSSALLLLYAGGAALGAIPAALVMGWLGPHGLFGATALGHAALAAFCALRMTRRAVPVSAHKDPFVVTPRTSPTLYALDPRAETDMDAGEKPDVDGSANDHQSNDRRAPEDQGRGADPS